YRPLMHAKDAELADVGVDGHLEDVSDHVSVGVRRNLHTLEIIERTLEEWRRVAFGRVRHQPHENVEQLRDARTGFGGDEADRNQMALAEGLLKRVMQLLRGEVLPLLEVERHEVLVHLDDLVDDLRVRRRDGGEIRCLAIRMKETVDDARAGFGRK